MAYASRYLVVDFWLLIILFIAASAIFSITVCIHNWSMPCHATLYHVMAFDRCSSVIINSYSLAAIHSTAICFISYQQFFYLFFFLFFVVAFCLFGYTRLNCRSSSFILFTFFSPVSSSCCFCCCCCWVFFRNVSYLLAATMCMFDFEFILKCSVRSELATSPLMWFSTFFSVSN